MRTLPLFLVCAGLAGIPLRAPASPFYEFTIIAKDGSPVPGGTVSGIEPNVSVNEKGEVAFIGSVPTGSPPQPMQQLLVGSKLPPRNISLSPSPRNFDFPQINNRGRIVTRELAGGNSVVRVWDAKNPGAYNLISTTSTTDFGQLTLPGLGNMATATGTPLVSFLGRIADLTFGLYANDTLRFNQQDAVSPLTGTALSSFRSAVAGGARVIVAQYTGDNSSPDASVRRISTFTDTAGDGLWTPTVIASTGSGQPWTELGVAPGISDSGRIIAFTANHAEQGAGIFIAVSDDGFTSAPAVHPVWTDTHTLARDEDGNPIRMDHFDMTQPVGVLHQFDGVLGLEGDVVILAFIAGPERASVDNPQLANTPLVFSAERGLWTLHVDFEKDLANLVENPAEVHPRAPVPVIQQGDRLSGGLVESIALYDPLANAQASGVGEPRRMELGDHFVAFAAVVKDAVVLVRGLQIDSDQDGLLDHWETSGIDMDGDGQPDLDLPAMGANPFHQDIFMELDWLNDRTTGVVEHWSCRPAPGVTERLAKMFERAPSGNPDGVPGIRLHIDAGPEFDENDLAYSVNMGTDSSLLDGGRLGAGQHPDAVTMGRPDWPTVAGLLRQPLVQLKRDHFGSRDKRAREFAFKYALAADFHRVMPSGDIADAGDIWEGAVADAGVDFIHVADGTPLPPRRTAARAIKITSGTGAGQLRMILVITTANTVSTSANWETVPDRTSRFVLFDGSGGIAESSMWPNPNNHWRPGNDFLMTLASFTVHPGGWLGTGGHQWRTLAHELGHTLGLRHGGTDEGADKKNEYLSLMSYSWIDEIESGIDSYSGKGDPTFNDWAYIKMDFFRSGPLLGASQTPNAPPGADGRGLAGHLPVPNAVHDFTNPQVAITAPAMDCATALAAGGSLVVTGTAFDDRTLESVTISFDKNGDGDTTDDAEEVVLPPGAGSHQATFTGVTGPAGIRHAKLLAADRSGNSTARVAPVMAGTNGAGVQTLGNRSANFAAQAAGGQRQKTVFSGIAVPSSGKVLFTVTGTPANRQAGITTEIRHDAVVERIVVGGKSLRLRAVRNPDGCTPSVCTSYWQAPAGGGTVDVEVLGPARYNAAGAFLGAPAQSIALSVTFEAVDLTPPQVQIVAPAADAFIETGETLEVRVNATDDFAVARVDVAVDLNGDGDATDGGENLQAASLGGGVWSASFAAVGGAADTRNIKVVATDTAGLTRILSAFLRVELPDTSPPSISIVAPPAGWPVKPGDPLPVQVSALDDIEMDQVEVKFDLNGDGDTTDAGETAIAPRTGINLFAHSFTALAGGTGSRTLTVTARDKAQNTTQASRPVTVINTTAVTQTLFTDTNHSIPGSPGQFSGGSQRVVDYNPITLTRSGIVTFKVTSSPNVRQAAQNIPRADPYVHKIWLDGVQRILTPTCNAFGSNPSICETSFEALAGGSLDFQVLGPGEWNIFGEFNGTPTVVYSLEITVLSTDHALPVITVTSPALGANQPLNQPLVVDLTVTDDVEVAAVTVSFDVNGDGEQNDLGEQVAAASLGGNNYRASFGNVAGLPGNRTITVLATDTAFNTTQRDHSVGVDGAGTGETILKTQTGVIPGQAFNGGSQQVVPVNGIAIPGMGRVVIRLLSLPNTRRAVTNLERYDAEVRRIVFNGQTINLTPVCNPPGSNPALCVSAYDTPGAGTLNLEIRGPAEFNSFGEFNGTANQEYRLEVAFFPGPAVATVAPATGSIGGHETVTVRGTGFGAKALVLFGDVAATGVQRISATEIRCQTPPGVNGPVMLTVLNADDSTALQAWNYGSPYGLFGRLNNGFTYTTPASPPTSPFGERLIGTWRGNFGAVVGEQPQRTINLNVAIPAGGQVRFEVHAFVPILNPVPGPFEDPTDLLWGNTSSSVSALRDAANTARALTTTFTELNHPWGPVIANSIGTVPASGAGNASFTVSGPARWDAFWRDFGEFIMLSAPAQTWVIAGWHISPHTITSVTPAQGPLTGGTLVTIKGTNFATPATVYFGQHLATSVTVADANTITCRTPAAFGPDVVEVIVFQAGRSATLGGAFRFGDGNLPPSATLGVTNVSLDPLTHALTLTWGSDLGSVYTVETSSDLVSWQTVQGGITGADGSTSFTIPPTPAGQTQVFFRVARGQ